MPLLSAVHRFFHSRHAIAIILLVLALGVRFWRMEYVPFQNDADEFAYSLAGQSLLEFGTPVSWSSFQYPEEFIHDTVVIGTAEHNTLEELKLVGPWFDHPFLLPLVQGLTVELFGYSFPNIPPSLIMRFPMLLLSAGTLWLVYVLGYTLFSRKAGLMSLLLVGFSPMFILGQRMVIGENLYTPLLLGALYATLKQKSLVLSILLAALATASKVPGAVTAILVSIHQLVFHNYRQFLRFSLGYIVLVSILFGAYAYIVDPTAFLRALEFQSFRLLGWSNPTFILANPGFHTREFLDATYYLTLLFGFATLVTEKRSAYRSFFSLSALALLFTIWGTSAEQDMLGWYKLPLFTFLAILAGKSMSENLGASAAALAIAVVSNLGLVRFVEHPLPSTELVRGTLILLFAGIFLAHTLRRGLSRRLLKFSACAVVVAYIGFAAYFSHSYFQSICTHRKCPVPLITTGQLLREVLQ